MTNIEVKEVYTCMWCGKIYNDLPLNGECSQCHQRKLKLGKVVIKNQHFSQIIKVSSSETLNSMRNGNLWFQSPKYFQEYDGAGQKARADIHDAKYSFVGKDGFIDDSNANEYRILCFYSLEVNADGDFLEMPDKQLTDFGDYFSIIDIKTLLEKIKEYIISQDKSIGYVAHYVKYLKEMYSGVYTPFCKFSKFEYQNEFRIVLLSNLFSTLDEKETYKTIPPLGNLNDVILEPQPLKSLLRAKNINEL